MLGSKKEIEICKYIKYDVSALTWVKISNFLVFREVLIMAIVIFVPLVRLIAQVAETHIDTWI